ncbi:Uncharacterised protein [Mycobacterium tuberculosis]|uniref:Uncharacterized protein n=1 Tax=Mycobacterium tuberculosis TaxID=1773 RepID=A0A0U0RQN4_MYCTX|nr:Uncharacterised protein [Mycobacterium tuberculosis]
MLPTGTGWESVLALGTTRAEKAGYGWTGCSTYPRRVSAAKARFWNARSSTW